jgi:hypothetical protein
MSARSLEIAREVQAERRKTAPQCSAKVTHKGKQRVCGRTMIQNAPEVERGVSWCPACKRYTDGSKGFSRI